MRVWFRRPSGEMRGYDVDTDDHKHAIETVLQHDQEAAGRPCLAVIEGGKSRKPEATKEPA